MKKLVVSCGAPILDDGGRLIGARPVGVTEVDMTPDEEVALQQVWSDHLPLTRADKLTRLAASAGMTVEELKAELATGVTRT